MATTAVDWGDVQGLVLRGYGELTHSRYFLLRIDDLPSAKAGFARVVDAVVPATVKPTDRALHVAVTAPGLKALGMKDADLATFSTPFKQGMVSPHRSRILGDFGPNEPTHWRWGSREETTPHVLVMLYARTAEDLAAFADELETPGCTVIQSLDTIIPEDGTDHFGFVDGISQPLIEGAPDSDGKTRTGDVAAGEMVIGYPDSRNELAAVPAYGMNGTYLVFRQMDQDVKLFFDFLERNGPDEGRLAAKLVGRWPDGTPTAVSPDRDGGDPNAAFDFADDPFGMKCPVGGHVRRANPRAALADPDKMTPETIAESKKIVSHHRILRRGRLYGPVWRRSSGQPYSPDTRGLHFVCLNANIANGFELIQQTWLRSTKFAGLYDEVDPLVGIGQGPDGACSFSIPGDPFRRRVDGIDRFVLVRGGAYFFMPGLKALKGLLAL